MLGTPAYMAPEQFAGTGGDARTDQFSFCVALYEGLYGRRPFAGDNALALMANVVAGTVNDPPPEARVPAWIRKILLRGPLDRAEGSLPVDDRAAGRARPRSGGAPPALDGGGHGGGLRRCGRRRRAPLHRWPARDVRRRSGPRGGRLGPRSPGGDRARVRGERQPERGARLRGRRGARRPVRRALDGHVQGDLRGHPRARRAVRRGARPAHGLPRRAPLQRARARRRLHDGRQRRRRQRRQRRQRAARARSLRRRRRCCAP